MMKHVKRQIIIGAGSLITILGLILMPVPGPGGTPVFLAGLAILATEVEWAKRFLARFTQAYAGMSKRKRLVLTYSMLTFYLVTGVVMWSWANRG